MTIMTDSVPHLLIVDDDKRLRELLKKYLGEKDFRVTVANDARQARDKLSNLTFDLIILDIMMPGESGLELTKSLRLTNDVPILLLTAMDSSDARIAGLEEGADDYLTKPFEPRELVLRIQSILRRIQESQNADEQTSVHFGPFSFDMHRKELRKLGAYVHLTTAESDLLYQLAKTPGEPIHREDFILDEDASGSFRAIDIQVTRLRKKIEPDPKDPRYIKTMRGTGYVLATS